MSIVIKGFDLPNSCADCPLEIDGRCGGLAGEPLPDGYLGKIDRPMFCPLVVAPEWISVDERLPEIDMYVLVYAIGKIDGFIGETVTAISKRFVFRPFPWSEGIEAWENPWRYFTTDYKVTHWMPLPSTEELEEDKK